MIIDVTGIILTPGNMGKDCMGNGEHFDKSGIIENAVVVRDDNNEINRNLWNR